ncbi:cupin domain-containing protein [Brevibacterium casei]|uniref:Cupin 2 conserved barrel domain protein n=1 Tax=Brevibacterium casei TaxID=33889 RepID=A0A162Z859_9MICO|nr:cupin domain-containing protein [Brevibacterium casei]KZE16148.1 cupin 2 conserved barrel domain protein [Brevibacterium casei]MCT1551046.1 cupin domain-containing protein [Brevibacterium casei]MCT1561118.1 cupin domain-containing protein [Brevibacterium casei]MCT2207532.1 cupin domain-containing protein [Brevibacterium casei]QPS32760.1 cupin domain-containing protein [Brevibacterium casei]
MTETPRRVADSTDFDRVPPASGSAWRLDSPARDLDANIIALTPGDTIDRHTGPALDVLIHVISGSGVLATDDEDIALSPGAIVWLPRRTPRAFTAGEHGLSYLSVHQRKPGLSIGSAPPQ